MDYFHDRLTTFLMLVFQIFDQKCKLLIPSMFLLRVFMKKLKERSTSKISGSAALVSDHDFSGIIQNLINLGSLKLPCHNCPQKIECQALTIELCQIIFQPSK